MLAATLSVTVGWPFLIWLGIGCAVIGVYFGLVDARPKPIDFLMLLFLWPFGLTILAFLLLEEIVRGHTWTADWNHHINALGMAANGPKHKGRRYRALKMPFSIYLHIVRLPKDNK